MSKRLRIGMLTPSSNTVLEPVTAAILSGLPDVSAHFGRFRVTEIALSADSMAQFDDAEILAAATLLSHAKVDVICWNGTSSGWLGFDTDEALCRRIRETTGIRACTSILALNEILARTGVQRLGVVSPYRGDVQQKIIDNYASTAFPVCAERHLEIQDNYAFCEVSDEQLRGMVREVASEGAEAVAIYCTNLHGAPLVEELEQALGIPVYDTVATAVWKALRLGGVSPARVTTWGRLFRELD